MDNASSASKIWATGGDAAYGDDFQAADVNDAAAFQQWLRETPLSSSSTNSALPVSVSDALRSMSVELHGRELAFNKSLRLTARTGDPVEGLAVQRQLSELYLSHGLAVKVIGKTTQALEQLMRMQ